MDDPEEMSADEAHRKLTNAFIDHFNSAAQAGIPIPLISSASLAAAGAYNAFYAQIALGVVTDREVEMLVDQFRGRVRERLHQTMPWNQ